MNPEQRLLIKKNLDILLRRKTIIIASILLAMAGGLVYYLQQPKIYQCSALIRYQRQSVNPTAMSPDDNRSLTRDVVNTVSQQITSRSSLEKLIHDFNLYENMQKTAPMENIVDMLKENHIQTRLLEGGDVFEVSYLGLDQQKVMDVTNALAQKFIDENLRFRQAQASQTSTYIRDELKMAKKSLDEKELTMRDYKLKYYNEMPAQLNTNTSRLNALQEQYQNFQESRLELERTRLLVQEQIAARIEIISQQLLASAASSPETAGLNSAEQIRAKLRSLQPRYTDNHPEVKRLKKLLVKFESSRSADPSFSDNTTQDPQIKELKQQLKDIEFNINRLKDERKTLSQQIKKYEAWIVAAPIREAEWSALTRDYDQLNLHYQGLVTQSLQAESAQSLENQLQGSQFKIVDSAHYPEKPLKPDFYKILLAAIAIGLGSGGALSFGLETLGTSFKDPTELEKQLGIPVICALPIVNTKNEIRKKRLTTVIAICIFLFSLGGLLSTVFYFWEMGIIIL